MPTLLVLAILCAIAATSGREIANHDIIRYLQRYGYLENHGDAFLLNDTAGILRQGVALFQEYYQLPGNGTLNDKTLRLMRQPRCGLEDEIRSERASVPAAARKWPRKDLRWNFYLVVGEGLRLAKAAFEKWGEQSALLFQRDTLNPDILISFAGDRHMFANRQNGDTCMEDFDGIGGTLAHAYFPTGQPSYVSEIHIDNSENWWYMNPSVSPFEKHNLLQTLVHEIGHSLGLSHSPNKDSMMYAFAPEASTPVKLSNQDIFKIQQLYGARTSVPPPQTTTIATTTTTLATTTTAARDAPTDLCALQRVDNVLVLDRRLYIAYERYVWPINMRDSTYNAPLLLTDYFAFLPDNFTRLSAAFQTSSDSLVLFTDSAAYAVRYPSYELLPSWPRSLTDLGLPADAKINAAIRTNGGLILVIHNDRIVSELNPCSMRVARHHALQTIFPGIPLGVTSAFRYIDGTLYFMTSKSQFYKFNEFTGLVVEAGKFDLQAIGIVCPRNKLLHQLRDLLSRIVRLDRDEERWSERESADSRSFARQASYEDDVLHIRSGGAR